MKPKPSLFNVEKRVRWLEKWKPRVDHRMAWLWVAVVWSLAVGGVACFWQIAGFP